MRKARNLRRDPRMALSIAPADNPFTPVVIRGRVVEWLDGDAAWKIIDQLATKYTDQPYPRGQERVVAVIEADHPRAPTAGPGLIRRARPHATLLLPKQPVTETRQMSRA